MPLPFSQRWRDAWSRLGRPALERFLGGFDVFHYSDWMYPPQAGGVRATTVHDLVPLRFPEWVTPKTASMHGAKYANTARTADLVFVNSEYTGRDVVERLGVASGAGAARVPGREGGVPAGGGAGRPRPPVRADGGHARAAQEPRRPSSPRTGCSATGCCSRSRAAAAGATSRSCAERTSCGSASSPTTSWRGSTAAPPWPSTPRASRASGCRSSRRWRAARPRSPRRTSRWTRPAATPPCGPIRTTPRRSPRRSGRRSRAGTSSSRRASSMRAGSRGAPPGEAFLAGYEEASA